MQLDHAAEKPLTLGKMFNELSRGLSIQEELESVALRDDMELIPATLVYIFHADRILERSYFSTIILADHQTVTPEAAMLPAPGGMEVPRSKNLSSDAHVPDVRVVTLELAPTSLVDPCTNINPTVSSARKPVEKL